MNGWLAEEWYCPVVLVPFGKPQFLDLAIAIEKSLVLAGRHSRAYFGWYPSPSQRAHPGTRNYAGAEVHTEAMPAHPYHTRLALYPDYYQIVLTQ